MSPFTEGSMVHIKSDPAKNAYEVLGWATVGSDRVVRIRAFDYGVVRRHPWELELVKPPRPEGRQWLGKVVHIVDDPQQNDRLVVSADVHPDGGWLIGSVRLRERPEAWAGAVYVHQNLLEVVE